MTQVINQPDRDFHLEALRGGMNRLLFRSNKSDTWNTRVEFLFMSVKYLRLGTFLRGPVIERVGSVAECADLVGWPIDYADGLSVFVVRTRDGDGVVVAGSVTLAESEAGAADPSEFFMMD